MFRRSVNRRASGTSTTGNLALAPSGLMAGAQSTQNERAGAALPAVVDIDSNNADKPVPGESAPSPGSSRLEALDGLRGLSILIVLLGHGASTADHPAILAPLHNLGIIGVDLFFAISGFIITLLLCRERWFSGQLSLPRFWGRRALRILPPFAVVCIGFWIAGHAGVMKWSWPSFVGAVTFTKNLPVFPGEWFFGHFWSLSVEEQFYLVWPLILLLIADERRLLRGLGILVALSPVLATFCALDFQVLQNLLPFLPYLGAGCMVAIAKHLSPTHSLAPRLNRRARLLLLMILPVSAVLLAYYHREGIASTVSLPGEGLLLPAAVLVMLVECVRRDGLLKGAMAARPLIWLGTVSYSVYLWQQLFMGPPDAYSQPWLWSTWPNNLIASIACGTLAYWLVERPSTRLKSALMNKRAA